MKALLAGLLALSLFSTASAQVRSAPAPLPASFVAALSYQLGQVAGLMRPSLPAQVAPTLPQASPAAAYLTRSALSLPVSAVPSAAPRAEAAAAAAVLARALGDVPARMALAAALRETGAEGTYVAEALESAAQEAGASQALFALSRDLARSAPEGVPARLAALFDGARGVEGPEAFAARAERLWAGGRLAPGGRLGVAGSVSGRAAPEGAPTTSEAPLPRDSARSGVPSDDDLRRTVELSPLTNPERERVIVELFKAAGAKPEEVRLQDAGRGRNNIYVVKKGRTDRVVVVGGHHDKVREGAGTIDNWTGATMVVNLYQALRELDTEATFVFVAFAREEEGLIGSDVFVSRMTRQERAKVDAMVNLDTLAVDGTFSWRNGSDRVLLDRAMETARRTGRDLKEIRLSGGDSDHTSFRRAGILAMMFFGASEAVVWDIIHSANDTIKAFSLPHYANAYRLTLEFLKELDGRPARSPRQQGWLFRLAGWLATSLGFARA